MCDFSVFVSVNKSILEKKKDKPTIMCISHYNICVLACIYIFVTFTLLHLFDSPIIVHIQIRNPRIKTLNKDADVLLWTNCLSVHKVVKINFTFVSCFCSTSNPYSNTDLPSDHPLSFLKFYY